MKMIFYWLLLTLYRAKAMLGSSFLFSDILVLLSIYARTWSLFVLDLPRALLRTLSDINGEVFCKNN